MNSVILPGVVLGDRTIVGAGSVVTKSFSQGNCVVAGNPAAESTDYPPAASPSGKFHGLEVDLDLQSLYLRVFPPDDCNQYNRPTSYQ